jgi:hypothetical protein
MFTDVGREYEPEGTDRQFGGWRVIASAWALVLLFVILFTGAEALACRSGSVHAAKHLAGAVIPQHDPCSGPGVRSTPGPNGCARISASQELLAYW